MSRSLNSFILAAGLAMVWAGSESVVMAADAKTTAEAIAADVAVYKNVPASLLQLRRTACNICHTVPDPEIMPRAAWEKVIPDMARYLHNQGISLSNQQATELQLFYQSFSPESLPLLPDDFLPSKLKFEAHTAGAPPSSKRPHVTNVNITDLDQNGRPDVVICDEYRGTVSWLNFDENEDALETPGNENELAMVLAPVHSKVFDFDNDGDLDIAVASMGYMHPNDLLIGEAILLINDGHQNFEKRVLISGTPRISDMQPGDIDGDGDIDFGLAMFGWRSTGAVGWLEQVSPEKFELHTIAEINGVMHMELIDLDQDGRLDLVTLISQQHEMILRFMNLGAGKIRSLSNRQSRTSSFRVFRFSNRRPRQRW